MCSSACAPSSRFCSLLAESQINPVFVKVAGIYWHFVDVVWFFVASQVYFW